MKTTSRYYWMIPILAAAIFISALTCACQANSVSSGKSSDLKLAFKVLGLPSSTQTGSSVSKSISKLILTSASSLTVSLTPRDSGLPTPAAQTVAISGTQAISVSFADVEWGNYTIKAVAFNASGTQFQQASTINVSSTTPVVTLNLVPANTDTTITTSTFNQGESSPTVAANSTYSFAIPAATLIGGVYGFKVTAATGSTCELFFQNSDGSLFLSADIAEGTYPAITYSDGNTVASGNGYDEMVTPSSSPSYITIYNNSSSPLTFTFIINFESLG
jgi:hypothetical protein